MSLQMQTDPPKTFFAHFELKGDVHVGSLILSSPLGNTLTVLYWSPQEAWLDSGTQTKSFASMAQLTQEIIGAALPLEAVLDWLRGGNTQAAGWQFDGSRRDRGDITARRVAPEPVCELRLLLD